MKAKDIMTRHVVTVSEETSIAEILTKLLDHRISGVPVTDAEGHVVGMVTEGDLILREAPPRRRSWRLSLFGDQRKLAEEFVKAHGLRARDVMTKPVITVEEETPIQEIAALLESRHIKRVPVLKEGKLVCGGRSLPRSRRRRCGWRRKGSRVSGRSLCMWRWPSRYPSVCPAFEEADRLVSCPGQAV